jgi:cellulose synthase/poly-beta-1,6-N-acetylglucosamine synthase-like glycosyltransferase
VIVLGILYILCLLGLVVYGMNSLWLTGLYLRSRNVQTKLPAVNQELHPLPRVTVQLPIYNERYTIQRLLEAVTHLDYPADRLQIQVLDDSNDSTAHLVRKLVARYQAKGIDIQLIQRNDRSGYKAGALAEGLKTATGELIAVFDADFVPAPDWLRRCLPEFSDPRLGCLQTRWGHLNRNYNPLTQAQALGIDGHFVIEQTARSRNGLFLNFNGTAGIWRRAAIETSGGWQCDTLTEDLDLSYRAQLNGWRIGYLLDVVVPAELPAQVEALKKQQFRWAKGTMQTVRKLLPKLIRADISWKVRLEGIIHLTGYLVHPLMLFTLLLTLPVALFDPSLQKYFTWTGVIAFGPPLLYSLARTEETPRLTDRLRMLPMLFLLGFGLSLNNTQAVIEGLFKRGGQFARTPKFNLRNRDGAWMEGAYATQTVHVAWGEVFLAMYAAATIALLWPIQGWAPIPWMISYVCGYSFMTIMSIVQSFQVRRVRPKAARQTDSSLYPM